MSNYASNYKAKNNNSKTKAKYEGQTYDSKWGLVTITEYRCSTDVDVRFENTGWETTTTVSHVKRGTVRDRSLLRSAEVGQIFETNNCGQCEVLKFHHTRKVKVRFLDTGYERECELTDLERGSLQDHTLDAIGSYNVNSTRAYFYLNNIYDGDTHIMCKFGITTQDVELRNYQHSLKSPYTHKVGTVWEFSDATIPPQIEKQLKQRFQTNVSKVKFDGYTETVRPEDRRAIVEMVEEML